MIFNRQGENLGLKMCELKSIIRKLFIVLLIVMIAVPILIFAGAGTAYAKTPSTQAPSTQVGFTVSADIPDNQINKRLTYFDLSMQPEKVQDLRVQVINQSNIPIVVDIAAISASTNSNGIKDYFTPGIRDETLKIPFSEIATVQETPMTVPANGSKVAIVTVKMPDQPFDGVILGGLTFTKQNSENYVGNQSDSQAVNIENVYRYALGVKLQETDLVVWPDFEFFDVRPELADYRPAVVNYIRNKEAAIANGINVNVEIYKKGSDQPLQTLGMKADMAPNSVMPLTVMFPDGLEAGVYRSVVTMEMSDSSLSPWRFEREFTITAAQADGINREAVTIMEKLPSWLIPLVIFTSLITLACIVLLILLLKKRRKKDDCDEGTQTTDFKNLNNE